MAVASGRRPANSAPRPTSRCPPFYPPLIKALSPFGVACIINQVGAPPPNPPPDIEAGRASVYSLTGGMYAYADEMLAIPAGMEQLSSSPMRLGDKPLIVLSGGMKEANQMIYLRVTGEGI